MPFPTYTIRLARGVITPTAALFTAPVPAGYQWILRDVLATNPTAAEVVFAVTLPGFNVVQAKIAAGSTYHLELRQVLTEAEQLVSLVLSGQVDCMLTAYQVTAPAPVAIALPA